MNVTHSLSRPTLLKASVFFLIILISLVIYFPSSQADFILDDYAIIAQNPLVKQPALYPQIFTADFFSPDRTSVKFTLSYYRPVTLSTFAIEYQLWGLNPAGYRFVNILIHSLVCFMMFQIVMLLFKEEKIALFSSLFFCIMPIHEGTINNIVGRADLLQALFLLVSLYQLLLYLEKERLGRYCASMGFFILAILSREVALIFPLFAALACLAKIKNKKNAALVSLPFFVIAGFYFLARYYFFPIISTGMGTYFSLQNIAAWFNIFFEYTARFIFPWTLQSLVSPAASRHLNAWFIWVFYILIFILPWVYLRFRKAIAFGFFWVILAMLPLFIMEKLVVRLGPYFSECFLYFSAVGFSIMVGSLLFNVNKSFASAVFLAFLVLYTGLGIRNNSFWASEERTLKRAVSLEGSYDYLAGMQLLMKYEDNVPQIESLIGRLDSVSSKSIWFKRLGNIYRRQGDYPKAIGYFKKALELNTENVEAYNELAVSYLETGHSDIGIFRLEESLKIDPQYSETYRLLGIVFYRAKNFPLAVKYLKQAVFLDPDNKESWQHLAMAYFLNAQNEEYQKILGRLGKKPNYALDLLKFAAQELYRHQEYANAALLVEKSLNLFVGDRDMLRILIESYLALGQRDKAEKIWDENSSYFHE